MSQADHLRAALTAIPTPTHHQAADHVVPKKRDTRKNASGNHRDLTHDQSNKCPVACGSRETEGKYKDSQHGAVKQRADAVDGLDQRTKTPRKTRKDSSVDAPEGGSHLGNPDVVRLGRLPLPVAAVGDR